MNLYFDTSALVKRYIREPGSMDVARWIDEADSTATSLITLAEANAAFARAVRVGAISLSTGEKALRLLATHWPGYMKLPLTQPTIKRAADLAWQLGLRGYDAVHLASADAWQTALGTPVRLVTYDSQLAESGRKLGLDVLPPLT